MEPIRPLKGLGGTLLALANSEEALAEPEAAERHFREAIEAYDNEPDPGFEGKADALAELGTFLGMKMRIEESQEVLEQSLELVESPSRSFPCESGQLFSIAWRIMKRKFIGLRKQSRFLFVQ